MAMLNTRTLNLPLGYTKNAHGKAKRKGKTETHNLSLSFVTIGESIRDFYNKISILALPAVITIAALLLLIPTTWINHNLRKKLRQESLSMANQLSSLQTQLLQLGGLQATQAYNKALAQDAKAIKDLVLAGTQRELLSYQLFPDPKDSSQLLFENFAESYCNGIDKTLTRMRACQPPAETLVEQTMKQVFGSAFDGWRSDPYGYGSSTTVSPQAQKIIDALSNARNGRVYINSESMGGYTFWQNYEYQGQEESLMDCWYGQLGY
ncbi:hypothetical protein ACFL6U_25580 [Planctomycetota bacterium]